MDENKIKKFPITDYLAAISVGVLPDGSEILDLEYSEDAQADVDMNIVMTGKGEFVEIQGTGEEATFSNAQLTKMLALAEKGMKEIFEIQAEAIKPYQEKLEL
ncbi:ribonuclease PH [Gracilibacillus boraciitolerans JCM 21714]|uniref:Ribonuclease PH n=1 Tax=Gracilibacillus boraciitolerans JCM 21714 TaxID=1298598 RepID=W4VIM4_9BACI|nr:ribonuclease PH [Gracilibacillus boraciitolerans JCM 21714]